MKIFNKIFILISMISVVGCNKDVGGSKVIKPQYGLQCKVVAHRGYRVTGAVENTEKAFIEAGKRSFWAIETDIYPTKDGVYICNHDNNIKGQTRPISDMTYDEIMEIDLSSTYDEVVHVCTFRRYLEICKEYSKVAYVELKFTPSITGLEYILGMIEEMGMKDHAQIISFGMSNMHNVNKLNQAYGWNFPVHYLVSSEGLLFEGLKNNVNTSIYYELCTKEIVDTYKEAGLKLTIWTLNDETLVDKYLEMGVETITSDFLDCDLKYLEHF